MLVEDSTNINQITENNTRQAIMDSNSKITEIYKKLKAALSTLMNLKWEKIQNKMNETREKLQNIENEQTDKENKYLDEYKKKYNEIEKDAFKHLETLKTIHDDQLNNLNKDEADIQSLIKQQQDSLKNMRD